ncbi:uncharacterized protein LOC128802580 isoform X3 [Vidua chalybeata]|uniref:uncharacterized protein LOC128802580 isoform X3 n=1 Tax=Vidua chalybeata TaxID=81927 RepID=UPI0023A8F164|nr:uncharacterized protein LOC128802580 isoform X3 [Vidua chalybeata]
MGEPPEAMVIKTFGGLDETCEPLLKKHMGSYPRGILAPCKDLHPVGVVGADPGQMSEAERRRIEADFERLRRLLAEQERTVLGRLAELDHTFAATHAEKPLRVTEGVAQLHRLIGQLEARCLPQDVGSIISSSFGDTCQRRQSPPGTASSDWQPGCGPSAAAPPVPRRSFWSLGSDQSGSHRTTHSVRLL